MHEYVEFEETMLGKTISSIKNNGDELLFKMSDGSLYKMYHEQDCCEDVFLEDVCGNFEDVIGAPILLASEERSGVDPIDSNLDEDQTAYRESYTWTFYKIQTVNGSVTLRWYGESNGYYSESVNLIRVA